MLDHAEQRVGLGERAVGEPHLQQLARMSAGHGLAHPEGGLDQRSVGLDVGAHHQDVAGLERRLAGRGVVGEQPEQHLAQDLDLTRRTVARVHLDAAVGRVERARGAIGQRVGRDVLLQPGQQVGPRPRWLRKERSDCLETSGHVVSRRLVPRLLNHRRERPLELAQVPAEGGEQGVADAQVGVVGPARDGAGCADEGVPERRGGVGQPQVDVAVLTERGEELHLGDGDPGVPEQREPRRQVLGSGASAERLDHAHVPLAGRRLPDLGGQPAPELGLPGEVRREGATGSVGVVVPLPAGEQGGALRGVRTEQPGQPPGDGVAAPAPELALLTVLAVAEVGAQRACPGLARAGVDHRQQRPDQRVRRPGVVLAGAGDLGDQAGRRPELDPGTDPVVAALGVTQPVGEPLAEPALDAASRDQHQLLGERVVQRRPQQLGQPVGEMVRARCTVDDQAHRSCLPSPAFRSRST